MTTIIATRKAMVADLQVTKGTYKYKTVPKIISVNGELVGLAGDLDEVVACRRWYAEGKTGEWPKVENIMGILVNKKGIFEFYSNGELIPVVGNHFAIGSGAEMVLGALEAGADLKTAMKVALKHDAGTGFGMTYLELETA